MISWDPVLVYRKVFNESAWQFFPVYFGYLGLALVTAAIVHLLGLPFQALTFENFLIRLGLCLVVPNGLWFILFRKRPEFQYLKNAAVSIKRKLLRH